MKKLLFFTLSLFVPLCASASPHSHLSAPRTVRGKVVKVKVTRQRIGDLINVSSKYTLVERRTKKRLRITACTSTCDAADLTLARGQISKGTRARVLLTNPNVTRLAARQIDSLEVNDNPIAPIVSVGVGFQHSCALMSNGFVRCWGENSSGQLGTGSFQSSAIPVDADVSGVKALAVGIAHTCALLNDASVKCWGEGYFGQLGLPGHTDPHSYYENPTPTTVPGLTGVTAISSSGKHTCAIINDNSVKCWGWGMYGQIGNGASAYITDVPVSTQPFAFSSVSAVPTAIFGGYGHSCALGDDGSVNCWGWNQTGQIGNGTTDGDVLQGWGSPKLTSIAGTSGTTTVKKVAAGHANTCALITDGTLQCWGYGVNGAMFQTLPLSIPNISEVSDVTLGMSSLCTVFNTGAASCWGFNPTENNNLIGPENFNSAQIPDPLVTLAGVTSINTNGSHTCASIDGCSIKCWGSNASGQLGTGDLVDSAVPVDVAGITCS